MKTRIVALVTIILGLLLNGVQAYEITPAPRLEPSNELARPASQSVLPVRKKAAVHRASNAKAVKCVNIDLLGDSHIEKMKIDTFTHGAGCAMYSELAVSRIKPTGESNKIWVYRLPETFRIDVDVSSLDPQNAKQSFLILNCAYGAKAGTSITMGWQRWLRRVFSFTTSTIRSSSTKTGPCSIGIWDGAQGRSRSRPPSMVRRTATRKPS